MRILLTLLVLATASVAGAQELTYEQLIDTARQSASQSRYREALQALQMAYTLRQDPQLLLELARGHRRLGNGAEMVDFYKRYRLAAPSQDPQINAEIDSAIASVPPPAPVGWSNQQPQFLVKTITRPNRGLLVGGAVLFSVSYSAAALTGGAFSLFGSSSYSSSSDGNLAAAGGTLFIPFLGPFISSGVYRNAAWVGPWVAVGGGTQLLGLALMIAARYRPETIRVLAKIPQVAPYASADGGGVNAAFRF